MSSGRAPASTPSRAPPGTPRGRQGMVSKSPDIYRDQREKRRRAYTLSPLVREEYPRLEHVTMELKFIDPAGVGHHSQQTHTFAAGARAYFLVSCPFSTCVDGGF